MRNTTMMGPKQEMARLTLASVALLLVGLMTTPLLETPGAEAPAPGTAALKSARPIIRKLPSDAKSTARAKTSKRLVLARR